jgi:hypothetical protein
MVAGFPVFRKICKQSQLHLPTSLLLRTACQTNPYFSWLSLPAFRRLSGRNFGATLTAQVCLHAQLYH